MAVHVAPPRLIPTDDRIESYLDARRRGTEWLLARQNADGSLGDPEQGWKYYRALWTFAATGEVTAAHAMAGFIRRNLLTPDGRIDGPLRKLRTDWAYRDATLIVGAQMIHQYDLGSAVLPSVL